jgi:hypothetical protein
VSSAHPSYFVSLLNGGMPRYVSSLDTFHKRSTSFVSAVFDILFAEFIKGPVEI